MMQSVMAEFSSAIAVFFGGGVFAAVVAMRAGVHACVRRGRAFIPQKSLGFNTLTALLAMGLIQSTDMRLEARIAEFGGTQLCQSCVKFGGGGSLRQNFIGKTDHRVVDCC